MTTSRVTFFSAN